MKPHRFIIAAGGTGGHLWPAVSLARALKKIRPESEFLFVGTGRPVEDKILGPENWDRAQLKTSGLKGRAFSEKVRALGECAMAAKEAGRIMKKFKPSLAICAGGYVTVPVGLAALTHRVPLVIHEQNSRPGISNKALAKISKLVMTAFEEAAIFFPRRKTVVTGNPVRPEIEALHGIKRDFTKGESTVLITGGSQGARALNEAAAGAMVILRHRGLSLKVIHQTGENDLARVRAIYDENAVSHHTEAFFSNMAEIYGQADVAVSRAGAITISEMAAARLPSILVPLPTAADDHQTVNARRLTERDAAVLLPQRDLTAESLAEKLALLLGDPSRREKMSRTAGELARLGADEYMAWLALRVMYGEPVENIGK